jgi:beta-glucosidase
LKKSFLSLTIGLWAVTALHGQLSLPAFRNANLSINERVQDLLHPLTLEEKISLLGFQSHSVDRLGIPAYNWWNEALHGVARASKATIFPQAIGMAASFNSELLYDVSSAISTEARAKYNLALNQDRHLQYMGLTFWSPNINIFRDPRWGTRAGNLRRRPLLNRDDGFRIHTRVARTGSPLPESIRLCQTFCRT